MMSRFLRSDRTARFGLDLRHALLSTLLVLVLPASTLLGVQPMPPYSQYPCATWTQNCQGNNVTHDLQIKVAERSSRSSCSATDPYGNCYNSFQGRSCPSSSQWCQFPPAPDSMDPQILAITHSAAGTGDIQLDVEYDFPNNYCQTWDPPATWPNLYYHNTLLSIDGESWSSPTVRARPLEAHHRLLSDTRDTPGPYHQGRALVQRC